MSATGLAKPPSTSVIRRVWRFALIPFVVAGLLWFAWAWWSARRYRTAMARVDAAMAAGRFGLAARELEQVVRANTNPDEANYVLGICEQKRGQYRAAAAAWARVAPGSAFTQRAVLARLRLFHDTGHLTEAEKLIIDAANDPRNDQTELLALLVPIFSQIGRSDEAERLIQERWEYLNQRGEATPEQSIKLVRVHIELTWKAPSVESLRVYLDQLGRLAPDDDRVWLGKANLAIQTGALDEAKRWLDDCQRKRPDDAPIWKARKKWGMAANRVDVVREALRHLPDALSTLAEVHRVNAWLCAQRGNVQCERRELEKLLVAAPSDLTALDRLAQLANASGEPARAAELRHKKAQIEQLRARYFKLYERTQHMRDAAEMARLADQLGRGFESRVFLTLALWDDPDRTSQFQIP